MGEVIAPVDITAKSTGSDCVFPCDRLNDDFKHMNEINRSMSFSEDLQQKNGYKPQPLDTRMVQSPITKCILVGNNHLMLECLAQGEEPSTVCSNSGRTYLHIISQAVTSDRELSWVPMVYQLSNAGIDMNVQDKCGITACRLAIARKLIQVVASMLKCGAELTESDWYHAEQIRGVAKGEMLETMRRHSPSYWSAVHDLTPFKVNRLVKAWARVNVSRDGKTLIEYAKRNSRDEDTIKLLIHHEASIELAHAVMAGDKDRVKTLLCDSAVDLNTCDTSVKNNYMEPVAPLTLNGAAIKLGHLEVLNEIIAAKERMKVSSSAEGFNRGRSVHDNNTTVVFYKGSTSAEEICQIRTPSKPTSSAMCTIL